MLSIQSVRKELQGEIDALIRSSRDAKRREQLSFVFKGAGTKNPTWGSLARGSLVLLLSSSGAGRLLLARSVELSHHASLIVDDQIDKAVIRRGIAAFWVGYSPEECILFSHYLVSIAIRDLVAFDRNYGSSGNAPAYALQAVQQMASAELEATQSPIDSLETYLSRARRKTGSLYRLVGELAALIPATRITDVVSAVTALEKIGIARQMLDDFDDATLGGENNVFVSRKAEEENRTRSIYQLLRHGFTLSQLRDLHEQYTHDGIQMLRDSLCDTPETPIILELCEQVCLGSGAATAKSPR